MAGLIFKSVLEKIVQYPSEHSNRGEGVFHGGGVQTLEKLIKKKKKITKIIMIKIWPTA